MPTDSAGGVATSAALAVATGGWSLVLEGISSYISGRKEEKRQKEQDKLTREQLRIRGDEDRRTSLYEAMLADYYTQKAKYQKAQGLANYTSFARSQGGYKNPQANSLMNYNSPNQVQNPGNAPPDPQALFGQPEGSASRGWRPLYSFDANGRLVGNNTQQQPPRG